MREWVAIHLVTGFGSTTYERLDEIERLYDVVLPHDYRSFIVNYNGCLPIQDFVIFGIPGRNDELLLGPMFGLDVNPNFDLVNHNNEYRDVFPEPYIVIGSEENAGLIIYMDGSEHKGVYYWDLLYLIDDSQDGEDNIYYLADTFDGFMSSLVPDFES